MRKQLTLKKLTLIVLSTLLCVLLAIAGLALGSRTQAFAEEPTAPTNPAGHTDSHTLKEGSEHVIYPATCVEPGISVAYCEECHCNVSVVLDPNPAAHNIVNGFCTICGEKVAYEYEPDETDPTGSSVVVQGAEGSTQTHIVIPDKIDGKDVKIAEGAFQGNTTLESVEIQGSVSIGDNAFEGCTNLESLTIEDGTETVGDNAFKGCEKLNDVTIPESVTSVGENAFEGTGYYTTPANWKVEDTHKVLYDKSEAVLLKAVDDDPAPGAGRRHVAKIAANGTYTLKDGVRVIADGAFAGLKDLKHVNLAKEALMTVGANAFKDTGPVSITLSANISLYEGLKELNINFFFRGDASQWKYGSLLGTAYFYSESAPTTEGNFWYGENDAPNPWELQRLQLNTEKVKTQYKLNESFSAEGLKVTAVFNGATVEPTGYTVACEGGTTLLKAGAHTVTVSYLGVEATYQVTVDPFTVTIKYGNGTSDGTATVNNGGENNYTLPEAPTRTGYSFNGWKVGEQNTESAGAQVTITADTTITAQWQVNGITVTPNYGGGEKGSSSVTSELNEASQQYTVKVEGTPIRTGYRFTGWEYQVNGGEKRTLGVEGGTIEVPFADNMTFTITAQWEQLYTITVSAPATAKVEVSATPVSTVDGTAYYAKNTAVTFTVKVDNGYKLAQDGVVVTGATANGYSFTLGTQDVTITVKTERVTVNVKFAEEYAGVSGSATVSGATATVKINGEPQNTGHSFKGWTAAVTDGDATQGSNIYTYTLKNTDVTITYTATWDNLYTVTVGEHANATVTINGEKSYYAQGETVTFTVTVANGYKLAENGVSVTGATLSGTYSVTVGTENVTITVKTVEVTVNLVWKNDDGTELQDGYATQAEHKGATATVTASKTPTKTGYTFKEWSVSYDETSTTLAKDGTLTLDLGNKDFTVTLTATWTRLTPTVEKVDLAGGTGDVTTSYTFDEKSNSYTVMINGTPTYEKHRFDGWTVSGDVEATLTAEQNTFTVTLSDNMTVTVTAKWVEQVTVTYDLGTHAASDASVPASETVDKDSTVHLPAAPKAAEGYEFTGWKVGTDEELKQHNDSITVSSDVTVTAQWTEVTYTLTVNATNAQVDYTEGQREGNKYHEGDVVKFKVSAEKGYKISTVTASNGLTGPVKGVYTLTFTASNITLTVTAAVNYGSATEPLSVEDALYLAEKIATLQTGAFTDQVVYVKGVAASTPTMNAKGTYYDSFNLKQSKDSDTSILVYSVTHNGKKIAQNDTITLHGYITNYDTKGIEFGGDNSHTYPILDAREIGESTITLGDHEGATVSGFDAGITLTKTNDDTFTFTVTPEGDNWIYSVKAGNDTLTAKSGNQYSFTVAGNVTITVKALKSNQRVVYKLATSNDVIVDGAKVVIASGKTLAGTLSGSYLTSITGAQFSDDSTITELNNATEWTLKEIKQENAPSHWEIVDASGNKLGAAVAKSLAFNSGTTTWTISIEEKNSTVKANITNTESSYGSIQYNSGANPTRFLNYTSNQTAIQLYVETIETVVVPYTYDVTEVIWYENALMMTISKQPEEGATVSLTVGGQSVVAQLEGDTVTTSPLPLESLTNGAEIVLKINDVTPTSWGEVDSDIQSIGTKNYSLSVSGDKLLLNIVDNTPEKEKLEYTVDGAMMIQGDDDQLEIDIEITITKGAVESASLQIGDNTFPYAAATSSEIELTFLVAPVQTWSDTLAVKLFINGEEYTVKNWTVENVDSDEVTIGGRTFTLSATADGSLQLEVKSTGGGTGEETVSGTFVIDQSNVTGLTNKYQQYTWSVTNDQNKTIGGTTYAYLSDGIQLNSNGQGGKGYFVSNQATPAPITKVTITTKNAGKSWELLTSSSPYDLAADAINPTSGTSRGKKSPSNSSVTNTNEASWTIENSADTYFALINVKASSNSDVLKKITIEYGSSSSGGSDTNADQQKVDAAAAAFTLTDEQKTYSEAKTYDLPTTASDGVTISWALKGTSTYCSVNSNKLTISSLPSEDTEVQLTATFSLNGKTATNDYTITIKKQSGGGQTETKTWQKLTDAADLVEGAQIVLVYKSYINNGTISSGRLQVVNGGSWSAGSQNLPTGAQEITLEKYKGASGYENYWLFKLGGKYLNLTSVDSNSKMALGDSVPSSDNDGYFWEITFAANKNEATIKNKKTSSKNQNVLRANTNGSSYWIANYVSGGGEGAPEIYIFKSASADDVKSDLEIVPAVYSTTIEGEQGTGASPILWISLVSVGAVLISLGAVVVILVLRKKSN